MDNNEFTRLHNFLEQERENSIESNDIISSSTSSSTSTTSVNYSVTSITEIINLTESRSNTAPTPPPRLKRPKLIRQNQEKSKVLEIASRFENINLKYQKGCNISQNESLQEECSSTSYQLEENATTTPPLSESTEDKAETTDSVSLDTPHHQNQSTVFRFKDASKSLPRPKTEGKTAAPRPPLKYHSFQIPEPEVKNDNPPSEDIQLRSKEMIPKEVKPIIDELISTEETYVENLRIGLRNYEPMFDRIDLPAGLRGKKFVLMGNVEQLLEFHETQFLPMLRRERHDITRLFNEFIRFLDEHYFYSYVIYTMNKKRSLQLCDIYKDYFKKLQENLGDKLGIMSFLVQPIQRLARYPLLLKTFNEKLFKVSPLQFLKVLEVTGKVEKRLKDLCIITNESEQINDIVESNDFNVFYQGHFKKHNDFNCTDYTKRRGYHSRVFLFDKCVIYTEIASDKRLIFRGCYPCEHIGVVISNKRDSFTLFYEKRKLQECTFRADHSIIENWVKLIEEMIKRYAKEEQRKWTSKYGNEKRPNLAFFRNSNRFSSDSGIGDMWQAPKPIDDQENTSPRTTWYAPY